MSQKISLEEALPIINQVANQPFKDLFKDKTIFSDILNKGKSGHLLEHTLIGLDLTSDLLDFTNGELKTVIWREYGFTPDDTMAITMVNTDIDDFLSDMPYEESHLYKKIKNFILVPVVKKQKSGKNWPAENWYYGTPYHVSINMPQYKDFYDQLKRDYYSIKEQIINILNNNGFLETTNGKYLQIRTKGSGKDTVCFSKIYNRNINSSGAAYAFYLKLDGLKKIKEINS